MKNLMVCLLLIMILPIVAVAQQLPVTHLKANEVPKGMKYEGKIVGAYQFSDAAGKHIVITTETGNEVVKGQDDFRAAKLFAHHYLLEKGQHTQTWRVYDAVLECPLDLEAAFIKNTFQITDLNKNGNVEIWLLYKTGCYGDVSPRPMKIIMYEGQNKFAIRGETDVRIKKGKAEGGYYRFDKAFGEGPRAFSAYAQLLWKRHAIDDY